MRSIILFVSGLFLLTCVIWYFSPDQEIGSASIGHGRGPVKAKSLSSEAPRNEISKSEAPKKAAQVEIKFAKSVGTHQGPPVPFKRRAAGDSKATGGEDKTPFDRYAKIRMGPGMQLAGKKRRVLAARAVADDANAGKAGTVAFKDLGYAIITTDSDATFEKMAFDKNAKPVVVNASNGRLGIVTGTLIVQVTDAGAADRLAGKENFQILNYDSATNLVYYRVPDGYEIVAGVQRVSTAPGVLKTEVEILEGFKEAR